MTLKAKRIYLSIIDHFPSPLHIQYATSFLGLCVSMSVCPSAVKMGRGTEMPFHHKNSSRNTKAKIQNTKVERHRTKVKSPETKVKMRKTKDNKEKKPIQRQRQKFKHKRQNKKGIDKSQNKKKYIST